MMRTPPRSARRARRRKARRATLVRFSNLLHARDGWARQCGRMSKAGTSQAVMKVRLHGPLHAQVAGTGAITGTRSLALIALLSTAPAMQRTRAWLVSHLWSNHSPDRARANLRQLVLSLKRSMGEPFDVVFEVTRDTIALRLEAVDLIGGPSDGLFLEGFDLADEAFEDWLRDMRQAAPPEPSRPIMLDRAPEASPEILPRIMVLPFRETQDATGIGDAVAHDLTGHFARSQLVDAISHFSCRTLSHAPDGLDQLADFVLTGQCRANDPRLILDYSLTDLSSGKVVWSDRQTSDTAAFLSGDDPATLQIAGQVLRLILSQAIAASSSRPLPELEAHQLLVSAVAQMHAFDRRHFMRAEALLTEVIHRCPDHSVPRAWLAQWHLLRIYQKWTEDPQKDTRQAKAAIANALDLNAACPLALALDGNINTILLGDFATAASRFDAAQAINPSSAFISQIASVLETFRGDGARAVDLTDRAFDLSPRDPRRPFFQTLSAGSYVAGGRYLEAVEMAEASIRQHPQHLSAHRCRVIGLQLAGQDGAARKAAKELIALDPDLNVSSYLRGHPAGETDAVHTWASALQAAGIPLN